MMKYYIDTELHTLTCGEDSINLYSPEAFSILSSLWLKLGWNCRYHYTFSWLGRPILQLPEDIIRLQEVLWDLKPDVIIETGIALGGSLLFYASLCALLGKGKVIGIDIDVHPTNRKAIEAHPLGKYISCIEGNSIEATTYAHVREHILPGQKVCVVLDANHSKSHVLQELNLYSHLVTPDSYIIVADGFKESVATVPRGKITWREDNPSAAVQEFLAAHPDFVLEYPERRYNRSPIRESITHFQNGWLRRKNGHFKSSL